MDYRVVASTWKVGPAVYRRGDVVPGSMLARSGPVSSWLRLGLIEPADAPDEWWEGLTKTEIVHQATVRGVEVDASKSKKQIVSSLKGGS